MFSLRLFGGVSLEGADGVVTSRAAQRHRLALLALLAASGTTGISRDKLIAYLWPEVDAERGRHLLSNSLYVLRQALGEDAVVGASDALRLHPDRVTCDVRQFEEALARGELERAVALYGGPFLDGFFLSELSELERWINEERERLAAARGRALEGLAAAAEGEGDFRRAAEWWKARAVQDPYDSRVALRLMQALEASGNRAGALQHAAIHERLIREELGAAPPPEVQALAERLRLEPVAEVRPAHHGAAASGVEPSPASPEPAIPTASPSEAARTGGRAGRQARWMPAVALVAIVAVGATAWAAWARWSLDREPERSIVVLPFENLSGGQANEYFIDGLTEEIITRLASLPELRVISRTSAMHYKGSDAPLRRIASELNVANVLEGSVRQGDGRLRITTQLIDARTDRHRWAARYDVEPRAIFRVQEQIAEEVVRALRIELGDRRRALLARQGTRDPVAYELYQRGRFLWTTRTREGHQRAVEYFQRAIERDSGYAEPYAGLADAYLTAYQLGLSDRSETETYSRLTWAAERAMALDDRSSDAHTSFAVSLWWQRNWPGAERELRRAIELNPSNATARSWYALLLAGMGRTEEAQRESRLAAELDPYALIVSLTHAWSCYVARDRDRAIEQFRRTLELNGSWVPAHAQLGLTYAQRGMHEAAIRSVSTAADLLPRSSWVLADLAYVTALAGQAAEARRLVRQAIIDQPAAFHIARAYVALGEPDSAFVWLERSDWQWPHRAVRADPALDPLRADPRFVRLVERVDREMGLR